MLDLIAAASVGGIIGFGICAVLTAGKVADTPTDEDYEDCQRWRRAHWKALVETRTDRDRANEMLEVMTRRGVAVALDLVDAQAAHTRCADALSTTQRKLSAIRDLLDTPRTIRKGDVRDVLDGETL